MTTYYVDGKSGNDTSNGSSGAPWKTLGKAASSIKAGDEVRARSATYHEQLKIRVPNTTWKNDTGHTPIVDGGYNDSLMYTAGGREVMPLPGPEHLPAGKWASLVLLEANGIIFDGFTVQNSAGRGIFAAATSDVVVRNCRVDFIADVSIGTSGGATPTDRFVIENNVLTRASVMFLYPTWIGTGAAIAVAGCRDVIVRNNLVAYIWGEGIDVHRGAIRTIVEGNIVHTCVSAHIYIQHAKDNIIRNNIIYHTGMDSFKWRGTPRMAGDGILIADETESYYFVHSSGDSIYNNIVVNTSSLLWVRNGSPMQNTQLNKTYIGYNTLIGGPETLRGFLVNDNTTDVNRQHINSIVENNIIANVPISKPIAVAGDKLNGILFRNNLWDRLPPANMRGTGDRIGNPTLVNASAAIPNPFPDHTATIDPRNYQLTSNSNLAIGMASDGSTANGLTPPSIKKDFFGVNRDTQPDIGAHEYVGVTIELTANFSIGPGQASGPLPHTVDFVDKSTSTQPIVSRQWSFGDGETSTETNPSHTYTKAGDFDVSLIITDDQGNTNTAKQTGLITVSEAPNVILPSSFRRFVLLQRESQSVLAYGTQYPDLSCILVWNEDPFHILNFDNIDDVRESNLASGMFEILWIDVGEELEPPSIEPVSTPTAQAPARRMN